MVIRGARIAQQMEKLLDEATYATLDKNTNNAMPPTTKRQFATDPILDSQMEISPAKESGELIFNMVVPSNGKMYDTTVMFSEVQYEDEDSQSNVTFKATDGEDYSIVPIELAKSNCKVRCGCLDFRWRFANWNDRDDSLYGDAPPPYIPKGNRPPVNPRKVPGVCKHLIKSVQSLKDAKMVR